MKKIKWELIPTEEPSDCWQRALTRALGMKRSELKNICKPFINDSGGLVDIVSEALLLKNGYTRMDAEYRVEEVINFMDSKHNDIVISTADHIFYVSNDTIYDNVTDYSKAFFLNETTKTIYYRVKGEML